ncbi:hypothetical protein LMS60_002565 [Listeria monocytogenes]|uniref:YopX family protein n=1 Tax=Listeria monocytogenes TaxID=1639 RepID=UPI0034A3B24D|nr:hypothetical protein [Listeria monocytogenes]EIM1834655.1 hypothetical protein [Listeria monocytogenes]EIM1903093.1 hypothetical protein [Listeria monocytogenes]EIM1978200.1 hypothetical protein [Listeria monocytogenes]EJN2699767.1 hypothetical protein [Listeria monocytogenes]
MREIEFRGKALISIEELDEIGIKHKNGYVYGDLVDNSHIVTGILESNDEYICIETWCGIDSETIGQYTGLKDKNGKKIFEGDIVRNINGEYSYIGIVNKDRYTFYIKGVAPEDNYDFADVSDTVTGKSSLIVIGNIHENPELLEAKQW